jgi:hypothetical protein
VAQQRLQGDPVGPTPHQLAALRAEVGSYRDVNALADQVTQQPRDRAEPVELLEQDADHRLGLGIRVEG